MVDPLDWEMFAAFITVYVRDRAIPFEFGDDVLSYRIRVRIGGVGDLECEFGQGETGILGARSNPENTRLVRRAVGVQPETGGSQVD